MILYPLGTLYSGCSRESSRGQFTQVRLGPLAVCVQCARDGSGGAQRKCVRVRRSRNEDRVGRWQSVEQAAHSQQRWLSLGDGRWGRVVGREGVVR
jgi:hypothetical protein